MKSKLFAIMMFGLLFSGIGLISAEKIENSTLKATIHPHSVDISVPDEILMPDIAPGYSSGDTGFDVINTGTADITVNVEITESDEIVGYDTLFFKKDAIDNPVSSEGFDFEILKPTDVGGNRTERIFAVLDLTGTQINFEEPLINQTYPLKFTAMSLNY